ncbi:hypothetical protein RQP46_003750 [Phenoliferia psychrophenolica]
MKRAATGAAAGGGRAAPGKRAVAALPLSDNFQAGDADLELHSSEYAELFSGCGECGADRVRLRSGVAFRVHKANLLASSKTFADMFDSIPEPADTEGLPTIELTEPASVLERILPYCYPRPVAPWELDLPTGDLELFGALDKYEIWRGIEAVQAAMLVRLRMDYVPETCDYEWVDLGSAMVCHAFSKHFKLPALIPFAKAVLAESVAHTVAISSLPELSTFVEKADLGSLCSHLHRDSLALQLVKFSVELGEARGKIKASLLVQVGGGASTCNGSDTEDIDSEWDVLQHYGSRKGLLTRDCNLSYRAVAVAVVAGTLKSAVAGSLKMPEDICEDELALKGTRACDGGASSLPTPKSTPTKRVKRSPVASTSALPPAVAAPPSPPARAITNIFLHAQSLLTTASNSPSASFFGRTHERNTLTSFLADRFPGVIDAPSQAPDASPSKRQARSPSLYVSGPPGIGKTALLNSVLADFEGAVDAAGESDDIKIHMENCQSIGSVALEATMWDRLCKGLYMPIIGKLKGRDRFEAGLKKGGRKFLIVLDEIDHILSTPRSQASSSRDLLHSLFALAHAPGSTLSLIGIANSLDLTARSLHLSPTSHSSSSKGKGVQAAQETPLVLPFKPYRAQDLAEIVKHRLAGLAPSYPHIPSSEHTLLESTTLPPLVDPRALELCTKRVAAGTGDVRTVLNIVAKAIAIVHRALLQSSKIPKDTDDSPPSSPSTPSPSSDPLSHLTPDATRRVSMVEMMAALRSSGLSAPEALTSRLAPLQFNVRNVLVGIVVALSRQSPDGFDAKCALSVPLNEAFEAYKVAIIGEGTLHTTLSKMEFTGALEPLESAAFVSVSSQSPQKKAKKATHSSSVGNPFISLNPVMTLADLTEALKTTPAASCERVVIGAGALQETLRISAGIIAREERRGKRFEMKRDDMAPSEGFHGRGLVGAQTQNWIGAKGKRPHREEPDEGDDQL